MDRSNGKEMDADIAHLVTEVDHVLEVRWIRARNTGQNLWLDINVGVNADYTIRKVDRIAERIREHIKKEREKVSHVSVLCSPV